MHFSTILLILRWYSIILANRLRSISCVHIFRFSGFKCLLNFILKLTHLIAHLGLFSANVMNTSFFQHQRGDQFLILCKVRRL
jgi:hypothetical protein